VKRAAIRVSASLIVAATLLGMLMLWGGVSPVDALRAIASVPPELFAVALVIHATVYCLRAVRFNLLMPAPVRPSFRRGLVVTAAHNLASYVLPAKTGEASFVVYMRSQCRVPSANGIASLLIARMLDGATLCGGLALACVVLGRSGRYDRLEWLGTVGAGLLVATLVFILLSIRGDVVVRIGESLLRWIRLHHWHFGERFLVRTNQLAMALRGAGGSGRLPLAAVVTVPIWLGVFGFYLLLAGAMGMSDDFSMAEATFGSSLAMMFNLLPVNGVAGMGTQETGWVIGFSEFLGVERELALTTGMGVHLVQLFNIVVMGLLAHLAMGVMPRLSYEAAGKAAGFDDVS
jgi:uncharacterized protein (TIRG00374 family)